MPSRGGTERQSTRLSSAETCDCSDCPIAAMSMTHMRLLLTVAVHPVRGGVLLGERAAHHAVGAHLDLGGLRHTGVHLDHARGMGEQQLDVRAVVVHRDRPPEAELRGEGPDPVALLVEEPGPRPPLEERATVVAAHDLLPEATTLDRGVAHQARALPAADEPRQGRQLLVEGGVEVEDHTLQSMDSGTASLVVKVTCGTEALERLNQGFTVAATAVAAGVEVSVWLTGDATRSRAGRCRRGGRAAVRRAARRASGRPRRRCTGDGLRAVRGASRHHGERPAARGGDPGRRCLRGGGHGARHRALVY